MVDFAVSGPELKTMVKFARKQPVAFAFNPGKSNSEHYLGMHRKREPALIAKVAKKEGAGAKVAFGSAEVDGTCLILTCDRILPALAKQVKKYLKFNKVSLNVQVLDRDGNILDSDIEDNIAEDPELMEETAGPSVVVASQRAPVPTPEPLDAQDIASRLEAQRSRLATLPGDAQTKLQSAIAQTEALITSGDLAAASERIDVIEAAITKVEERPGAKRSADKEAILQLIPRLKALKQAVAAVSDAGVQSRLSRSLEDATSHLRASETVSAAETLAGVEQALAEHGRTAAAAGGAGGSSGARLLPIWQSARESVDVQFSALQAAMRSRTHPLFQRVADAGFNGITGNRLVRLQAALMDMDTATEATRATALKNLRKARSDMLEFLKSDKLLPLLETNPLGVKVNVRSTLARALKSIDLSLAGDHGDKEA
ncbi:hypothetical protein [Phaeobacter sp. B1627]|uniref:hypothetical protein n=1 Tax=Phaeobacter sp. B1627 TaxID=2583809 RepID=UPI00111B765D|nr:hypothetical protein [Phaeobacter sp. B1627]TNJ46809.1 hypothetical protein FGE21_05145 [Phaeobacter sp. B1627]